ncbi:TPA: PIN domain-containing protein [Candidatus Poribacteria bacterium]|nr:PIN domain-containing protein [Candidatus Poribacteria bacterium]
MAIKRSFLDELEPIIYWDSSFAIAVFLDTELYHDECEKFRQRLNAEGVLSVVGDFVYDEAAFFLIRKFLEAEGKRTKQHWRDVKRTQPNFINTIMSTVKRVKDELNDTALWIPSSENVKEKVFQLMQSYSILPTDAFHLAVALSHGVTAFATLDADFLKVDGITVYTCLP